MNAQVNLVNQYLEIFKKPTLKEISIQTGIQLTRVFRILNGSEMKVSEYQAFKSEVNNKRGLSHSLEYLLDDCETKVSSHAMIEIEDFMQEKLRVWHLMNSHHGLVR